MHHYLRQKGQVLVLVALALVVLISLAGLAIDGGNAFSTRRHAQNAADAAAYAAALDFSLGGTSAYNKAVERVASNGFTITQYKQSACGQNDVNTLCAVPIPSGACGENGTGKDYTVNITAVTPTYLSKIIGFNEFTNDVTATVRACQTHKEPFVFGNAVAGLCGNNCPSIDVTGNNAWHLTGGGFFANGVFAGKNGNYPNPQNWQVPNLTSVGSLTGNTPPNMGTTPKTNQSGATINYPQDIVKLLPESPCPPGPGKVGQTQAKNQTTFENGVYCISDFDALDKKDIILNNATLYITDTSYDLKFAGGGGFSGTATKTNTYSGSDIYAGFYLLAPPTVATCTSKNDTPSIVYTGNGKGSLTGTFMAPSACIDVRGNSDNSAINSQVIGHVILGMGTADVKVNYKDEDNADATIPPSVEMLK